MTCKSQFNSSKNVRTNINLDFSIGAIWKNPLVLVPEIECNHNIIPKIWRIVGQLLRPHNSDLSDNWVNKLFLNTVGDQNHSRQWQSQTGIVQCVYIKEDWGTGLLGTVRICRPKDLTLQRPDTCSIITHHNLGNQIPDVRDPQNV